MNKYQSHTCIVVEPSKGHVGPGQTEVGRVFHDACVWCATCVDWFVVVMASGRLGRACTLRVRSLLRQLELLVSCAVGGHYRGGMTGR
jgi:hypothetical protein